jgi:hypothetical protein
MAVRRTAEPQKNSLRQEKPTMIQDEAARELQSVEVAKTDFTPRTFNTEDLDIPTFLRNRIHN